MNNSVSEIVKSTKAALGWWGQSKNGNSPEGTTISEGLREIRSPLFLVNVNGANVIKTEGTAFWGHKPTETEVFPFSGFAGPCPLENLGSTEFCKDHNIRYPYLGGSMAKGISSTAQVKVLGEEGMLGFFGAAGLSLHEVEEAIERLSSQDTPIPFGFNLIHSPNEPDLEKALVDLYLRQRINLVEASAFLDLTLPLVRFRVHNIHRDSSGEIQTPNRIIAKISREEIAAKFFAPPPERFLRELVASGDITNEQAELAAQIPMAQDVTAEADSGGHTDNRPAIALFPTINALKSKFQDQRQYRQRLRVGLAGGISTPAAAAAAFSMGAAYIMTGSVNQACIESGTSDEVRDMLAETRQADVTMAPAADMFEMGVDVQVLKRGTMFSMRASKLYELYRTHESFEDIPAAERQKLEKTILRAPFESIWQQTKTYFTKRDPAQIERAEQDPKHKMALVFRWYLGQSPHWAKNGENSRRVDYQIWCGPAMGAFNEWAKGSFLEKPANRKTATIAYNILFGAAVTLRASQLTMHGIELDSYETQIAPLEIEKIKEYLS